MHADLSRVDAILARYPRDESSLVMVLQDIQSAFRFLPCEALEHVAREFSLPRTRVFSVATFYKVFSLKPQGETVIQVCKGTACHVRGAQLLEDELCRQLNVQVGETTPDGKFTIRTVNCVGACAMAPVLIANDTYHAEVAPAQVARLVKRWVKAGGLEAAPTTETPDLEVPRFTSPGDLLAHAGEAIRTREALKGEILVCGGPGCLAAGSRDVYEALKARAEEAGLPVQVRLENCRHADQEPPGNLRRVDQESPGDLRHAGQERPEDGQYAEKERLLTLSGCQGLCQQGPLVHIRPQDILYTHVKPSSAAAIVEALSSGGVVESLLGETPGRAGHPFYQGQVLQALELCGRVDPESLEHYLSVGGFQALAMALSELQPAAIVDRVTASGLRGRGGAGFPTGRKWQSALRAARSSGNRPFVLCNGDEGDPGAFMDRVIMEGSPFQVLEGMILGAYALGGKQGFVYVRHEYPLAVRRLEKAIRLCRRAGLLGDNILGTDLCFDLNISRGGGAFVCGESTALMRSIEGKVGEPRAKYTRSVERGLYDSPTVLNNVETWSLVPRIVRHGAESFAALGTDRSKGTKAFSLVGQVRRTGLVEVPMGTTLRELIFDIGGGPLPGRTFKAVQTGGPSGGCLPESKLDLPIDFDALTEAGSMMGSGGMIIMDNQTCMVDVAHYFVDFLASESCGKCVPCRLGLPQLSYLLDEVRKGRANQTHLKAIEEICEGLATNSLCGLGKSAPNPVLSTLRYFREEYEAHLEGRCPAGVCKDLIRYEIDDQCVGCLLCIKPCPTGAIRGARDQIHVIDEALCTRCGICRSVCKYDAVRVVPGGNE